MSVKYCEKAQYTLMLKNNNGLFYLEYYNRTGKFVSKRDKN